MFDNSEEVLNVLGYSQVYPYLVTICTSVCL
jgi:hypothetical protein